MKIPEGLKYFSVPTMLVLVDLHHVKGFLVFKDEITPSFALEVPAEKYTSSGAGHPGKDLNHHVFGQHVVPGAAKELAKHTHEIKEIVLFIHKELLNIFRDGMPTEVNQMINSVVEGDLIKEPLSELLKRLG